VACAPWERRRLGGMIETVAAGPALDGNAYRRSYAFQPPC
jgi:hypothetical protein